MFNPNERQYLVYFGPRANCTFEICTAEESVYGYAPSFSANLAFIILFAIANLVHIILGFRWKTWRFMSLMNLGCVHEVVGYVARVKLHYNPWSFVPFIIQIITITQAPVFYCAAIYITLGRCINHFAPSLARFPPKYLYRIFLPCDVLSLLLQGVGGAMSASSSGDSRTGVTIAMAGLIFQVITLTAFCGLFADFFLRYFRSGQAKTMLVREKVFLGAMSLAIITILVRCIFRTDELRDGYHGETIRREYLFIGLEGVLIVIAVFSLCVAHPGLIFDEGKGKYATVKDENVELLEETKYVGAEPYRSAV